LGRMASARLPQSRDVAKPAIPSTDLNHRRLQSDSL
jgi:hypothetical protein